MQEPTTTVCGPLAAVPLDRVAKAAFEGRADQMWFETVLDRRAEAAAVSAIHGSQPSTMRATNHRIANSLSDRRRIDGTYLAVDTCHRPPLKAPPRSSRPTVKAIPGGYVVPIHFMAGFCESIN